MMRKGTITGWKRAVLAALLAYAFVLQTVLVSVGGAAHAAEAAGPQGILCLQSDRTQPDHSPASAHDGSCCTLGCHGAGSAGPAPGTVFMERLAFATRDEPMPVEAAPARPSSNVFPVGSRAPPGLV